MRKIAVTLATAGLLAGSFGMAHADVGVEEDDCATVVAVAPGDDAPGLFLSVHTDSPNVWVYSDDGDGEVDRGTGGDGDEHEFDEATMTEDPACAGDGSDEQIY